MKAVAKFQKTFIFHCLNKWVGKKQKMKFYATHHLLESEVQKFNQMLYYSAALVSHSDRQSKAFTDYWQRLSMTTHMLCFSLWKCGTSQQELLPKLAHVSCPWNMWCLQLRLTIILWQQALLIYILSHHTRSKEKPFSFLVSYQLTTGSKYSRFFQLEQE